MNFASSESSRSTHRWRKSSRSANNAHCVEVSVTPASVGAPDTKDRTGGTLVLDAEQWCSFVAMLKRRG